MAGLAAAVVTVGGVAAGQLLGRDGSSGAVTDDRTDDTTGFASQGPGDVSNGLRAYAAPYDEIHLGGNTLPWGDREYLDTDAVATAYGIVYYESDGIPTLLRPDGRTVPLLDEAETTEGWHPTAKADAAEPLVAFARLDDPSVVVHVYDLEKRKVVATTSIVCGGDDCSDLVIDGIDSGLVFLRMQSGTAVWDYERDESYRFAGRDTRVADVRNRVVLYDGAAPDLPLSAWRYVPGAIDSQLTFDGSHVLRWSSTLEATTPGEAPIVLQRGPESGGGYAFWTFDTDGSVLVAEGGAGPDDATIVYDCEVPSGACAELGPLDAEHGDPLFIGNDM